ncbi:MAG: polyprenol monophosphomannose synthase [Chloroflexi bacterium]|nr:polyprenol monophosphomannose synthase [Chloroflexota bacterium]
MQTTVVIPTYNEAANLPELVHRIMAQGIPDLRILFVDDSSPDGTAELAERLSQKHGGRIGVLKRPGKQGLGTAYIAGFREALKQGADYIIEMDADLSHAPEELPRMLEAIKACDVVVGSRWTRGGGADKSWGVGRRFVSKGGSLFARVVLGLRVKDTTTGFKCFRRAALEAISWEKVKSQGFAFQVEVAYACERRGFKVVELPITFANRARGKSKMSMGIVVEALRRVVAIRLKSHA